MSKRIAWITASDRMAWRSTEHRFRIEQNDPGSYVADDFLTDAVATFRTLQGARDWCNRMVACERYPNERAQ